MYLSFTVSYNNDILAEHSFLSAVLACWLFYSVRLPLYAKTVVIFGGRNNLSMPFSCMTDFASVYDYNINFFGNSV